MSKYLFFALFLLPLGFFRPGEDSRVREDYVLTYREVAVREMERSGVPASIKLAQAILESDAGRSELAIQARNHFGIKCGSRWNGRTYALHDDDRDAEGRSVASCFRVYRDVRDSYADHSAFLRDPAKETRYGFLFRLPPTDYRAWARGLQRAGYATNPRYADLLIDLIERHELHQYDLQGSAAADRMAGIGRINDVRVAYARPGETLFAVAQRTGVREDRLVVYNEERYQPGQALAENSLVYLQPKRTRYREKQTWHIVRQGETMGDIAQQYGLKTRKLRDRNRIPDGHEPVAGQRVKLRWRVKASEVPQSRPMTRPEGGATPSALQSPTTPAPAPPPPGEPSGAPASYHTVAPGETLWRIARQYGVSPEQIQAWNQLSGTAIQPGQKLRIK